MSDFFAPYAPADHGVPLPVCTRAATVADAGEIARIYLDRHGAEPGTDPGEIRQAIRASLAMIEEGHSTDFVAVAEVRGRVCGYGRCGERSWPEAPEGWYLVGIIVAPQVRRRGIGRALTKARLAWLRSCGVTQAWYFTSAANPVSVAMHKDMGFVEHTRAFAVPGVRFTGGEGILFQCTP